MNGSAQFAASPVDRNGVDRVVHVSCDFPDPIDPGKTPVIRTLLELTQDQFAHRVLSYNRRSPGAAGNNAPPIAFDWGEARVYTAPPYGILHAAMLHRLGERIARELAAAPPALLVGHKLTIEGLAVARAARLLGVPYAITIQGNSDTKILAMRPDLRREFARVFHGAAAVFAFAPWALDRVISRLGVRAGPTILIPCPTDLDTPLAPLSAGQGLLSAFHLRHQRNKNLAGIAAALRQLRKAGTEVPFTLVGGGASVDVAQARKKLSGISGAYVSGAVDRTGLRSAMNSAVGFVLPSHRETFGLVFIEALFAGIPVIYPADRAIAGHFDGAPFAIPVDPRDTAALAAAMARLVNEEAALKQALAGWQQSEHARQFMRPQIAARFAAGLREAITHGDSQMMRMFADVSERPLGSEA